MKKMGKFLCMLLAVALVFALCACGSSGSTGSTSSTGSSAAEQNELDKIKAAGVLTVAMSPDFSPMEFVDSSKEGQEQYVGFDVFLANYVADYLGVKLDIQAMSFDACQTAVSMGSVDMSISGYSWTETRAENYELSIPYKANDNEDNQVLLIRAADADKYTSAEDFNGVQVGAQNASLQMQFLTEQLPDAIPYTIGEIGVGVLELQSGNIEALAVAIGNGKQIIANNPDLMICDWEFEVASEYTDNVIMMHKGHTALLAAVNEALAAADEAGYYPDWYAQALDIAASESAIEVSIEDEA